MNAQNPGSTDPADSIGSPDHERSSGTIDETVAQSEKDSQAEGVHSPSGAGESDPGESRVEKMRDVDTGTDDQEAGS